MKKLFILILLIAPICLIAQKQQILPSAYDRKQDIRYYDDIANIDILMNDIVLRIDTLENKSSTNLSWEINILSAKVLVLETKVINMDAQVKRLVKDSIDKSQAIKKIQADISTLNTQMITALKVIAVQGKAGEINIPLINGVYVISLDPLILQRIQKAEAVTTKLEAALK